MSSSSLSSSDEESSTSELSISEKEPSMSSDEEVLMSGGKLIKLNGIALEAVEKLLICCGGMSVSDNDSSVSDEMSLKTS